MKQKLSTVIVYMIKILFYFSIFYLFIKIQVSYKENPVVQIYSLFFAVLMLYFINLLNRYLIFNLVYESCQFYSYIKQQERSEARRKGVASIKYKNALLIGYLYMGKYEKCQKLFDELSKLESVITDKQMIHRDLCYLCYTYYTNNDNTLDVLKKMKKKYEDIAARKNMEAELVSEKYEFIINVIELQAKQEWNLLLHFLETQKKENVLEQVYCSYLCGLCYCQLENYEEAVCKLQFAKQFGGETKFVKLSEELLNEIPKQYTEKKVLYEKRIPRKNILLPLLGILILLFIAILLVLKSHSLGLPPLSEWYGGRPDISEF